MRRSGRCARTHPDLRDTSAPAPLSRFFQIRHMDLNIVRLTDRSRRPIRCSSRSGLNGRSNIPCGWRTGSYVLQNRFPSTAVLRTGVFFSKPGGSAVTFDNHMPSWNTAARIPSRSRSTCSVAAQWPLWRRSPALSESDDCQVAHQPFNARIEVPPGGVIASNS